MRLAFCELNIWKKGFDLLMDIYDISGKFPANERYSLVNQITRSANGVIANIAEAHGRYHYADKIRVLYIARGEIEETRSHLRVAYGRSYINEKDYRKFDLEYEGLIKGVNTYINYITRSKNSS